MNLGTISIIVGLFFLFVGFLHQIPVFAELDGRMFTWLHQHLRPMVRLFQVLWHFGRTPFALICLVFLLIYSPNLQSLTLIVAFGIAVGIEAVIKVNIRRQRPYQIIPGALMLQPREPKDTSFPSGDALRIWFLITAVLLLLPFPPSGIMIMLLLGILVSLGRIAMGVHFPLDVLAGTGLGLTLVGIWFSLLIG